MHTVYFLVSVMNSGSSIWLDLCPLVLCMPGIVLVRSKSHFLCSQRAFNLIKEGTLEFLGSPQSKS